MTSKSPELPVDPAERGDEPVTWHSPFRREDIRRDPFPHLLVRDFLSEDLAEEVLRWMESRAAWQPSRMVDFYETCDLNLRDAPLEGPPARLLAPELIADLVSSMSRAFDTKLDAHVRVTAHRMIKGQSISPHTDLRSTKRLSHRLLIQLNRGWTYPMGGLLAFLDDRHPAGELSAHKFYLPSHRLAIGFEISAKSFHSVSAIVKGERYTLCYSFSPPPGDHPGS